MNNSIEKLYKSGSNESTPKALDNLILNAAKQSCETHSATKKPKKWLYMLSTAAIIVMGFSVVFNLQNQNAEMTAPPEYDELNFQKDDLQTKTVAAPPLEPHPKPQKKRKRVTSDAVNESGLLGKIVAEKPKIQIEQDSSSPQIEKEPQLILNKAVPVAASVNVEEREESFTDAISHSADKVMVTGMRRAVKPSAKAIPERKMEIQLQPQSKEIDALEKLIKAKKYKQAQELLKKLESTYPNSNWQKYKDLVFDSKE